MRKKILFFTFLVVVQSFFAQSKPTAYKSGEWLRFDMSYSGFLKAGTAVLQLKEKNLNNQKVLHAIGTGKTTGVISWFFKVDDRYESYFGIDKVEPYLFKRKIDEGGHKKNRHITFNHNKNTAYVQDFLKKKDTLISVRSPQDMISTFYFLRSQDTESLKKGQEIRLDMFFDDKSYPFKLRFLGYETVKTKFGKVKTQKFRPLVQAGRVFKAKESVTIWITADDNKIPVKMKASLAVGSLRAELDAYKGLANPFEIIID